MSEHNLTRRWLTGAVVIAAACFPPAAQAKFDLNPPPAAGTAAAVEMIGSTEPTAREPVAPASTRIPTGSATQAIGSRSQAASKSLGLAAQAFHNEETAAYGRLATSPPQQSGTAGQPGFQWDDAAIGAAGTLVLLGAAALTSGVTRRRRTHRTAVG
jgi:hypothetical protein